MSLSTNLRARMKAELVAVLDEGQAVADVDLNCSVDLASGTGANQADQLYSDTRTLAASASEVIDVWVATAQNDPLNRNTAMVKIKAILIKAAAANTNNVVVGPDAGSNPFIGPFGSSANTLSVPPGGWVMLAAPVSGWAAGATASNLTITNSAGGTSVTYDIQIVGTSS